MIELLVFEQLAVIRWRAWTFEIWLVSFQVWDGLIGSAKVDLYIFCWKIVLHTSFQKIN